MDSLRLTTNAIPAIRLLAFSLASEGFHEMYFGQLFLLVEIFFVDVAGYSHLDGLVGVD